jgi:hypothetical protein
MLFFRTKLRDIEELFGYEIFSKVAEPEPQGVANSFLSVAT